ncbi:MAG: prenyltransferase/squalene oxidase repeat-containing protein [Planctomycetota bacterium]|nr:prenyltransferase/squalene oxidase repeat-containing protein [Planctomycetota bacterium]
MSQADLQHDSAGNQPSGSISPRTGDGQAPAAVPPPPPSKGDAAGSSLPPVPPPPPVRSSLPPVRPAPESARPIQGRPVPSNARMGVAARGAANGVGSAKGLRWRGETANVKTKAANSPAAPTDENGQEEEEWASDRVTREAPPWLVSMVVHLVLLLVLALISTPVGAGLGSVMLSIGQSDREVPAELAEFSISTDDAINDSELMEESEVEVDMASIFDSVELNDAEEISPMEFGAGPNLAAVRPMFDGRSGAMKKALLAIYGGTAETQDAVARGLAWLKRNQQKNGSWSMRGPYDDGAISENECAATAMALLAFLGDGNTHIKGEYRNEVEKGVKHLLKLQERSGFMAKAARGHEKMYAQAQATIALCELYGMTKDSWLRGPAQLAIDFAEDAQSPQGGWRYEPNVDSDTSITGWYVMALESGRSAGLEVNVSVLTKVDEYLDGAQSYDGAAYGYQINSGASPAMTAEGLLCRQYISWKREHPPLRRGIDALLLDAPFTLADRDVYYWYYATQVLHHFGGPAWRKWNDSMKVELPKAQVVGGRESGSWPPQMDRWGRNHGRLYTTCLSLFCLEVYYRHMPLYQAEENSETN